MSQKEIQQHSNYHCFKISREGTKVVLRAKRYLFCKTWLPECGIKLLKDRDESDHIPPSGVAKFRIDSLNLDQLFIDLNKFFLPMELERKMNLQTKWGCLWKNLESLPNFRESFPKLDVRDFVVQEILESVTPSHLSHLVDEIDKVPDLIGEKYPEVFVDGDFQSECMPGVDMYACSRGM